MIIHDLKADFVEDCTHIGLKFRMLNIGEFTRECLPIFVPTTALSSSPRRLVLGLARSGAKTVYIELDSPWENDYCESFNSKLRNELLKGEIFCTLQEAQVIIDNRRRHYDTVRPHSSLGYRPPAPKIVMPACPLAPRLSLD